MLIMENNQLTFDEAALFNSYNSSSRRTLVNVIIRSINVMSDPEAKAIAQSLRYKVGDMSNEEYKKLYKQIPLDCGF